MNLALFKIKTMDGQEFEVEAFCSPQAIAIWSVSRPKDLLFRSCLLIKSTEEIDRYWELKTLAEPTRQVKAEVALVVDRFRATDTYKRYKKFSSFKNDPTELD